MTAEEIKNEADMMAANTAQHLQAQFVALAHKHASVSFWLIGTLVLVMGLMGFGGYEALKSFDAQLARAEQREAQYNTDRKTWQDALAQHDAERVADATKIASLEAQVAARDKKPLPPPVTTPDEAVAGLQAAYSDVPAFGAPQATPDGKVAVNVPQAQILITTKLDLNRLKLDLTDEKAIVDLQKQTNASLSKDLTGCQALNVEANKTIADYKKLAKKSRWQKFLSGAEKVGLVLGGMYVGHKI